MFAFWWDGFCHLGFFDLSLNRLTRTTRCFTFFHILSLSRLVGVRWFSIFVYDWLVFCLFFSNFDQRQLCLNYFIIAIIWVVKVIILIVAIKKGWDGVLGCWLLLFFNLIFFFSFFIDWAILLWHLSEEVINYLFDSISQRLIYWHSGYCNLRAILFFLSHYCQ